MFIKEVLTYDWNYAEYVVSDGKNDLVCMCESVPLPLNQVPKVGMKVSKICAFTYADIKLIKIEKRDSHAYAIKNGEKYFEYYLHGKIVDRDKALIHIHEFDISLEKDFEEGLPANFANGDCVEFFVDRLDCTIE